MKAETARAIVIAATIIFLIHLLYASINAIVRPDMVRDKRLAYLDRHSLVAKLHPLAWLVHKSGYTVWLRVEGLIGLVMAVVVVVFVLSWLGS